MLYKKVVLKNLAKFTGKHLCQSISFNKAAGRGELLDSFPPLPPPKNQPLSFEPVYLDIHVIYFFKKYIT